MIPSLFPGGGDLKCFLAVPYEEKKANRIAPAFAFRTAMPDLDLRVKIMIGRIISVVVAIAYLLIAYFTMGGVFTFQMAMFLILPLSCIWFSDLLGGYTGCSLMRGNIDRTTPGCFVAFGGWLLLFLPVIMLLISFFS